MATRKAANGDGSITSRTLADGRTVVFDVWWSYRDEIGRTRRGNKRGFRTKREATAFRRQVTRDVDRGSYVNPAKVRLGDYLDAWLAGLRLKPQTVAGYRAKIRLHILPRLGHLPLGEITARQLNAHYRILETEGSPGGNGPLSLATIRHVHNILSAAYTAAEKERLVADSPTRRATPPKLSQAKAQRPQTATWTAEQVRHFLEVTADDHYNPLWRLLASTGVRRGEALGLTWTDIDFDRNRLTIRRSVGEVRGADGSRTLVVGSTKNDRPRVLALDGTTMQVLRMHRARQAAERLRLGDRWQDRGLVFCRGQRWLKHDDVAGGVLDPDRISEAFRRDVARSGLPQIRLHDLRHTWATLALQAGVHPKVVQEHLGHGSITITLDLYSHVTPGMDEEATARVAGMFS